MVKEKSPTELDTFSDLLDAIYRTPLQTGQGERAWQPLLSALRDYFDCNFTVLKLRQPSATHAGVQIASGEDYDASNDLYNRVYNLDPFVNLPVDQVVSLAEYVDVERLRRSEFYKICLEPGDTFHILGVDFSPIDDLRAGLRLCRPERARPFSDEERRAVARLIPHIRRAVELYRRLNHMELERSLYAGALAQLAVATFLLDNDLRILGTNAAADNLLNEADDIRAINGTLTLPRSSDQRALRELVAQAGAAHQSGEPTLVGALPVERSFSGRPPLGLVVQPLPESPVDEHGKGPTVSLFISDPSRRADTSVDVLCQLFGFTRAEARLAIQLANGQSLKEAAAELGITPNTGRAHLRAIFTKTGVSQQTQLVSLILKSAAGLT